MRYVMWLLVIFAAAVVAAITFGRNDGTVAIAWGGWRADLSLNLFLAALVLSCVVLVMAMQAMDSLLSLPKRARDWRVQRRDRAAQSALRESLADHFAARYRRAQKAAQRSASILDDTPELDTDGNARMLAHLMSAASAHKLQDRNNRTHHLRPAAQLAPRRSPRCHHRGGHEGAQLLAVEWALDDRDAAQALTLLEAPAARCGPAHPGAAPQAASPALGAPTPGRLANCSLAGQTQGVCAPRGAGLGALAGLRSHRLGARRRPTALGVAGV